MNIIFTTGRQTNVAINDKTTSSSCQFWSTYCIYIKMAESYRLLQWEDFTLIMTGNQLNMQVNG